MAERRPLVIINGVVQEISPTDTVPTTAVPPVSAPTQRTFAFFSG